MGKNFCKVEHKWCKFCKHNKCNYYETPVNIKSIHYCPKIVEYKTVSLKSLINTVKFEDVMKELITFFPNQVENINGYKKAWIEIKVTKLEKCYIYIALYKYDDCDGNVHGCDYFNQNSFFCMEFMPWKNWLYMNIHPDTLKNYTNEQIVAACLYEMTWAGYSNAEVQESLQKMQKSFEEIKVENNKKK